MQFDIRDDRVSVNDYLVERSPVPKEGFPDPEQVFQRLILEAAAGPHAGCARSRSRRS